MPQIQNHATPQGLLPIQALPSARSASQSPEQSQMPTASFPPDQLTLPERPKPMPVLPLVGQSLTAPQSGQSMNQRLMHYFANAQHKPLNQPVYAALANRLQQAEPISLSELEQLAFETSRQQGLSRSETAVIAYESLMAAAIEHQISAPDFFEGESDKLLHYLASATLTARAYQAQPHQFFGRSTVAYAAAYTVGLVKEMFDNVFSREDIQANQQGIQAALKSMR